MRPLVEAKLQFYQDLKLRTDEFVAWTSELNSQGESMEILGRSSRVLQKEMQLIVDALVDKEQADVRKICAPLFVHATNPPLSPGEDKIGVAISIEIVCIILYSLTLWNIL
jgi:hypothetical protein